MVTLLLGAHGCGKSTYIIDRIKEDYKNKQLSLLIVPEQQTVVAERQLTEALPPSAQLYTEATNLTRLANSVFRKTGGLKYNYITKGGQTLIMYRAICEVRDVLKQYKIPRGREKSCISLFLQAIGEMKSYGVDIARLENALPHVESESLKARIEDIITVWSVYDRILSEMYDDPYDDLRMLEKKLGECAFFKDYNIYIDSFYGFTKSQLDVITRLIQDSKNVTVALDCPVDAKVTSLQYAKIAGTKAKLTSVCKRLKQDVEIIPFDTDYKHATPDLAHVCHNLWQFDAPSIPCQGNVSLALADDEFSECEYVCAKIKELIQGGEQYGSIAIIARNTATYQGIIDFCLKKYEIPHYMSVPSRLTSRPVVKMVLSALNTISAWRSEDLVSYLKCGYTDISQSDLCLFESYVYRWSIFGKKFKNDDYWSANPDGFVGSPTKAQLDTLAKIQAVREKVIEKLSILEQPFIKGLCVRECCVAVYEFLNAYGVLAQINKEIRAADNDEAQELSQVWYALMEALELVANISGDSVCDIDTFITLLSYAMMDSKIGTIPTGEDVVTIADASLVRAKNIRHVFVLGANEGTFPAVVNDNSFFTDRDKIELETLEIDLSAKTDERGDDELLFFKNALSVASHSATVLALKKTIGGQIKEPSIGYNRIKALLSGVNEVDTSRINIIDKIYTKEMARELLGTCSRELQRAILDTTGLEKPVGAFVNDKDTISEETAGEVFGERLYLSKSTIETFAKCRFNYYCSYILKLRDSEKIKFTHNDIGTLVHAIFEHFLKLYNKEQQDFSDEEILELVTRLTDDYTQAVCGIHAVSSKMKHLLDRLKSTVCVFVKSMLLEIKSSKFAPEHFEVSINGDGKSAPLPLEFKINDGCTAVMTGIADRVDICRKGNTAYIKIVDYKTGNYEFKLSRIKNGLDMQMLIYLLALCSMQESEFRQSVLGFAEKIEPAGIMYLSYRINKTDANREVDLSSQAAIENEAAAIESKVTRHGLELDDQSLLSNDNRFNLGAKSQVSLDDFGEIFELVKSTIVSIGADMLSGGAEAKPLESENPCKYCKNNAVCRRRDAKC